MGSRETHETGLWAETLAAFAMRLRGWRVLARRYKTPVGEIDLVLRRGRVIAFAEVKRRRRMDEALAAVTPATAARVRRAAAWWLQRHAALADKCDCRFDVIAIAPYASIRHIPNAF